jgi:hypothetical protein
MAPSVPSVLIAPLTTLKVPLGYRKKTVGKVAPLMFIGVELFGKPALLSLKVQRKFAPISFT